MFVLENHASCLSPTLSETTANKLMLGVTRGPHFESIRKVEGRKNRASRNLVGNT